MEGVGLVRRIWPVRPTGVAGHQQREDAASVSGALGCLKTCRNKLFVAMSSFESNDPLRTLTRRHFFNRPFGTCVPCAMFPGVKTPGYSQDVPPGQRNVAAAFSAKQPNRFISDTSRCPARKMWDTISPGGEGQGEGEGFHHYRRETGNPHPFLA